MRQAGRKRRQRGLRRHLVVAVKDDGEGRPKSLVERLEKTTRENGQSRVIFGSELRQTWRLAPGELVRCGVKIVENRGDVGIALVELVPQRGELAVLEVARGNRGLAAPGRTRDPDRRAPACFIEQAIQAFARNDAGPARPGCLGERDDRVGRHRQSKCTDSFSAQFNIGRAPPVRST